MIIKMFKELILKPIFTILIWLLIDRRFHFKREPHQEDDKPPPPKIPQALP